MGPGNAPGCIVRQTVMPDFQCGGKGGARADEHASTPAKC